MLIDIDFTDDEIFVSRIESKFDILDYKTHLVLEITNDEIMVLDAVGDDLIDTRDEEECWITYIPPEEWPTIHFSKPEIPERGVLLHVSGERVGHVTPIAERFL